jgi:hypothetical protein
MAPFLDPQLLEIFEQARRDLSFADSICTPEYADMWVRLAISDHSIADQIFEFCEEWLTDLKGVDEASLLRQALCLHYIRTLGARHLLPKVMKHLSCHHLIGETQKCWFEVPNPLASLSLDQSVWRTFLEQADNHRDGRSYFAPLTQLYYADTMGQTALNLFTEIALSIDPLKADVITLVSEHLSMREAVEIENKNLLKLGDWLWDNWQVEDGLQSLLIIAYRCINGRPDRSEVLALRLALIAPEQAEQTCAALTKLPIDQKRQFATHLEKQLKRVGKIKLWVHCRKVLFGA